MTHFHRDIPRSASTRLATLDFVLIKDTRRSWWQLRHQRVIESTSDCTTPVTCPSEMLSFWSGFTDPELPVAFQLRRKFRLFYAIAVERVDDAEYNLERVCDIGIHQVEQRMPCTFLHWTRVICTSAVKLTVIWMSSDATINEAMSVICFWHCD